MKIGAATSGKELTPVQQLLRHDRRREVAEKGEGEGREPHRGIERESDEDRDQPDDPDLRDEFGHLFGASRFAQATLMSMPACTAATAPANTSGT